MAKRLSSTSFPQTEAAKWRCTDGQQPDEGPPPLYESSASSQSSEASSQSSEDSNPDIDPLASSNIDPVASSSGQQPDVRPIPSTAFYRHSQPVPFNEAFTNRRQHQELLTPHNGSNDWGDHQRIGHCVDQIPIFCNNSYHRSPCVSALERSIESTIDPHSSALDRIRTRTTAVLALAPSIERPRYTIHTGLTHRSAAPQVVAPTIVLPTHAPHERWRHLPSVFAPSVLTSCSIVPNFILKHVWLGSWGYNDVYKMNRHLGLTMLDDGVDDGPSARRALERRGWDAPRFALALAEHNRDVAQAGSLAEAAAAKQVAAVQSGAVQSTNDWPFP